MKVQCYEVIREVKVQGDGGIYEEVKCKGRAMAPGSTTAAATATAASSHVCNSS